VPGHGQRDEECILIPERPFQNLTGGPKRNVIGRATCCGLAVGFCAGDTCFCCGKLLKVTS